MPNTLLSTDVYKLLHGEQYPPDTTEVYSYLEARKPGSQVVWFGLQYYINQYLGEPVTRKDVKEFIEYYQMILGPQPEAKFQRFYDLADLGYWPLEIKALPEGDLVDTKNALMTIRNTHPEFAWCVGYLESLLLKVWNPCTVATFSLKYKQLVEYYASRTCDNTDHVPFAVHDFGYRGVSSEETAAISGAAHLLNFLGTDTIPAIRMINENYQPRNKNTVIGASVPASEHSVMCSYTKAGEFQAFDRMLELYPTGIVSIVSDTYDLWNVLNNWAGSRKKEIRARTGKVVFRPDSGDPIEIICGDKKKEGAIDILWRIFGGTKNEKGYKVLHPSVGLIYGDGMYYERFQRMLARLEEKGFASSNLVIGVGGLLLQSHTRDDFGFAIKATNIIRGGKSIPIFKDPITDPGKKSKTGYLEVGLCDGAYYTQDGKPDPEHSGLLQTVFVDGELTGSYWSIEELRANLELFKKAGLPQIVEIKHHV